MATSTPSQAAGLSRHLLSEAWGDMDPADFAALVEDVRARGVQQPITIYQGEIADGWHRARACAEAGLEDCPWEEFTGDYMELVAHVESLNRHRRHVPSRKTIALAVARVRVSAGASPDDGLTVAQVAASLGMHKRYYQEALKQARREQGIEAPAGGRPRSEPEGEPAAQETAPPDVPTGTAQAEPENGPDIPAQTGIPQDPADPANPAQRGDVVTASPRQLPPDLPPPERPPEQQVEHEARRLIELMDRTRTAIENFQMGWGPLSQRGDVRASARLLESTCRAT